MLARLSIAAALLISSPVLADPPPAGFQFYCLRNNCKPSGSASIPYTDKLMVDMSRVTTSVNRSIRYRREARERWQANVSSGDCEDFALTKRHRLIRMGYPASALRMAVGRARGEYHAVLVVVTSNGRYVLDNLTDHVLPINKSAVRIRKMASANPMVWG